MADLKRNVHIPFIKLTFGSTSFSWSPKEDRPDYFTGLSHKRVNDKANTITINLQYCPKVGESPNALENAIVKSKGECLIQYGDLGETVNLYKGLVHSYSIGFNEGVLAYKLSLVSAVVCYTYEKFPGIIIDSKTSSMAAVEATMRRIVSNYMSTPGSSFKSYTFETAFNMGDKLTFSTISVPPGSPLEALKSIIGQLRVRKHWVSEVKNQAGVGSWQNRYQGKMDLNEYRATDHSLEYYLSLEIDESGSGTGKIRLVLVNSNSESDVTYSFEWGGVNSEVLSWDPQYDGAYSIFKARGTQAFDTYISSNSNGEYGYTTFSYAGPQMLENGVSSSLLSQVESLEINENEIDRHYEYKASITVLGKSKKMKLGQSKIQVIPLVSGSVHHTAGTYVVIGVEDNVSSQGFTTTYQLYKSDSTHDLYGSNSSGVQIYHKGKFIPLSDYKPESGQYSENPCPVSDQYNANGGFVMSSVGPGYETAPGGDYGGGMVPGGFDSGGYTGGDLGGSTNYTDSPLAQVRILSPNCSAGRATTYNTSGRISRITIHHMAGNLSVEACGSGFRSTSRKASSTYGIGSDGKIGQYVMEKNRPWTSSSRDNDSRAITIEVANAPGAGWPDWKITDAAMKSLIDLCADICTRNNIRQLVFDPSDRGKQSQDMKGNLTMHKWFAATACPGPYLESKFPYIAQEVNKKIKTNNNSAPSTLPPGYAGKFFTGNKFLGTNEQRANATYIKNRLCSRGWTLQAVCGMLGNFQVESSMNPGIWQGLKPYGPSQGHGYGLAQWTPYTKYTDWCNSRRIPIDSMDSALQRIEYECEHGYQFGKTKSFPMTFQEFKRSTKTPYYLAMAFLANYERPYNPNQPSRGRFAEAWYRWLTTGKV